ncbi:MAG: hypothetical protein ACRCTA_04850 [Bacilli bacterium]
MQHKYMILSSMYRYTNYFFEENPSLDDMKSEFLDTARSKLKVTNLMAKPLLKKWYDIEEEEDVDSVIALQFSDFYDHMIVISNLIKMKLASNDLMVYKDEDVLNEYFKSDQYFASIDYAQEILSLLKRNELINENVVVDEVKIKETLKKMFTFEQQIAAYSEFLTTYSSWLTLIENQSISAFNLARVCDIIAFANVGRYYSDAKATRLLDAIGNVTTTLFSDWQTYLISAMMGKDYMIEDHDEVITYQLDCLKMATNPLKPLEISGVWTNSDISLLQAYLPKIDIKGPGNVYEKTLALGNEVINSLLSKYDLEYLLEENADSRILRVALDDENEDSYLFYQPSIESPFEVNIDEIPLILRYPMVAEKVLMTTKGIQVKKKKFLKKATLTKIAWSQVNEITYKIDKLSQVAIYADDQVIMNVEVNFKAKGYGENEFRGLEDNVLIEKFQDNLNNIVAFFKEVALISQELE